MVEFHERRQFDGWPSQSGLKAAILGDIAIPPLPSQAAAKGWEVLRGKNAAKFGPYIELWVNIPSLCGSHLGKMDPQASPNYAWQAAGGAQNVRALSNHC